MTPKLGQDMQASPARARDDRARGRIRRRGPLPLEVPPFAARLASLAEPLHKGAALFIPGGAARRMAEVSQSRRFNYCFARNASFGIAYGFQTEDENG